MIVPLSVHRRLAGGAHCCSRQHPVRWLRCHADAASRLEGEAVVRSLKETLCDSLPEWTVNTAKSAKPVT